MKLKDAIDHYYMLCRQYRNGSIINNQIEHAKLISATAYSIWYSHPDNNFRLKGQWLRNYWYWQNKVDSLTPLKDRIVT